MLFFVLILLYYIKCFAFFKKKEKIVFANYNNPEIYFI